MKIALVHNHVDDEATPDARDVLVQAQVVKQALEALHHEVLLFSCSLNLDAARQLLAASRPDLVFNLVEDLGGYGRLIHCFPFLLDALGLGYTGTSAEGIYLTSNKIIAKEKMRQAGIPTPVWAGPTVRDDCHGVVSGQPLAEGKWIIKSLWEHASMGLDAGSIVETGSASVLESAMRSCCARLGGACFAEEFIAGREFNLSILAAADGPEILPPAEISFSDFAPGMVRIVDYRAKWDENSFHYNHTPRRFAFPERDQRLLKELMRIAMLCWEVFRLAGYARVDFRVDDNGNPFVLEINANPCLSPDAGFAAALSQAGIGFTEAVGRILADAPCRTAVPPHWNKRGI